MGRKKFISLFVSMIFLLCASLSFAAEEAKPYDVGSKVKSVELTKLDGEKETVSFDKGITAISFFASSCSACRAELSLLNSLMKQSKDLRVIAVCVDAVGAAGAERFKEQTKFDFDYFLDTEFQVAEKFGFTFTPGLVLVSAEGEVFYKKGGYMNRFEKEITSHILK